MTLRSIADKISYAVPLLAALTLTQCSGGFTVKVDYDKQANFSALRSFAFKEPQAPSKLERLIREAIQRDLSAKGYLLQAAGQSPDFDVVYHAAVEKKTIWQRQVSPAGVPTGIVPITFDEGTLAIQMLQPVTGKVIWTGQAAEAVDNQAQELEEIQPAVNDILARFPPR